MENITNFHSLEIVDDDSETTKLKFDNLAVNKD